MNWLTTVPELLSSATRRFGLPPLASASPPRSPPNLGCAQAASAVALWYLHHDALPPALAQVGETVGVGVRRCFRTAVLWAVRLRRAQPELRRAGVAGCASSAWTARYVPLLAMVIHPGFSGC